MTGDALDFTLETLGIARPGLRERLMQLYLALEPFPEVPGVLAVLRRAGHKTAILSNGTPAMLYAIVTGAGLGGMFDAVLSVEEVGAFKPDRRVYQLAVDRLGVAGGGNSVPVVECVGCPCGIGLRHAGGVVQSLRPAA